MLSLLEECHIPSPLTSSKSSSNINTNTNDNSLSLLLLLQGYSAMTTTSPTFGIPLKIHKNMLQLIVTLMSIKRIAKKQNQCWTKKISLLNATNVICFSIVILCCIFMLLLSIHCCFCCHYCKNFEFLTVP